LVVAKLVLRLFPNGYELNLLNLIQTRYEADDLLISALVATERGPVHFRSYARSVAQRDRQPPEAHGAQFNGDNYSLSLDVVWEDSQLPEDITQGFPMICEPSDRPFQISELPGGFQISYRHSWLVEILERAKRAVVDYFPEARFDAPAIS